MTKPPSNPKPKSNPSLKQEKKHPKHLRQFPRNRRRCFSYPPKKNKQTLRARPRHLQFPPPPKKNKKLLRARPHPPPIPPPKNIPHDTNNPLPPKPHLRKHLHPNRHHHIPMCHSRPRMPHPPRNPTNNPTHSHTPPNPHPHPPNPPTLRPHLGCSHPRTAIPQHPNPFTSSRRLPPRRQRPNLQPLSTPGTPILQHNPPRHPRPKHPTRPISTHSHRNPRPYPRQHLLPCPSRQSPTLGRHPLPIQLRTHRPPRRQPKSHRTIH